MKKLAIIPAKAFSKRVKNKNIKSFFGKPLIEYTIKNLIKSKIFDKIHISTDSKKIVNIGKKFGIKHDFLRPKKLTKNNVSLKEVLKYVVEKLEKKNEIYDIICLAYATSPLLEPSDYIKAYKNFKNSTKNLPLISVSKFKPSIGLSMKIIKKTIKPINTKLFFRDTKKHLDYYFDSGSFMFFKKNMIGKNYKSFQFQILPYEKSLDIDTNEDFEIAKKLYSIKNK